VLQGKELSYNNLADAEAAWANVSGLTAPSAVLIKHANPCGTATATNLVDAFKAALASDPVSAFGGILAVNREVDGALVTAIDKLFLEVIIAPAFSEEARTALAAKKNLRLLIATPETHKSPLAGWMVAPISGGYLVQQNDAYTTPQNEWKTVTGTPDAKLVSDAALAWHVVKFVKSNAIVLVKNGATIGVGAGQMSRVDSVRIAIEKARAHGHDPKGAVLASDAFLPFADNVELAAEAGIGLIIQPGGSMRDSEVIDAANKHSIAMLFTSARHFKH
jgi:phosphoribosylaminoimidazolecarboxamide formyltransferase/IMP cyclohydrolase